MILVAENLTVTNRVVAEALERRDPAPLLRIVSLAAAQGIKALDLNLGPRRKGLSDSQNFLLDTLEGHWTGELWLDGHDPALMEEAILRLPVKPVLNGYCGGNSREEVLKLAAAYGTDLVIFLMDDRGVPKLMEDRLSLAAELLGRALVAGVDAERIIIDPVVAPLGWMDGQEMNAALANLLPSLRDMFGEESRSVVGLSNLTTRSARGVSSRFIAETFLAFAAGRGLTHAMVDIENPNFARIAAAIEAFQGRKVFAPEEFQP